MNGIFIPDPKQSNPLHGPIGSRRPNTKKEVNEHRANLIVEITSLFSNLPKLNRVRDLPDGIYPYVGPDPYTRRNFYGTVTVTNGKVVVT
jgi:hypothetical protein